MESFLLSNKIGRQSLYDYTVIALEKIVYGKDYETGDKLPSERELCDLVGVSRTILREALRTLEYRGLITIFPGKGAYIRKPAIEVDMANIYGLMNIDKMSFDHYIEMRKVLEPNIARLAAEKARAKDVELLEKELNDMTENLSKGKLEKYIIADQNFHVQLAVVTNNPMLMMVQQMIIKGFVQVHGYLYYVAGASNRAIESHNKIFDAIKNNNHELAYKAMETHINQIEEQYVISL